MEGEWRRARGVRVDFSTTRGVRVDPSSRTDRFASNNPFWTALAVAE
jgi:hypothetical protein